jgi:hypothetical protein
MANSIAACSVIDPPSLRASAAGSTVTLVLSIVTAKLDFPKSVNCNDYRCRVAVALVEHASFVDIITLVLFHDVRDGIVEKPPVERPYDLEEFEFVRSPHGELAF